MAQRNALWYLNWHEPSHWHTYTHSNLITSHCQTTVIFRATGMYSSLYTTCGQIPLSNIPSFHIQISVCLFTVPQRLRTAPGILRHRPTDPMPYRGWHLAAYVSMHPSFFAHICTYGQVVGLGLVSLQILFSEIESWLVCSTHYICCLSKIRNKPS